MIQTMEMPDIRTVLSPRSSEAGDFIEFPKKLYRDCRFYVPWFDRGMQRLFARKSPFFRHSDGEFFVAYHGTTPVGRIALFENRNFNSYTGNRDARFYFFDTENDQHTADALFNLAANWARSRGLTRLIGPQGFSSMAGGGILIQGFDQPPAMTMMGYNYPYYQELLESAGFCKYKDFVSAFLDPRTYQTPEKISRVASIAMKRGGFDLPRIRSRRQMRSMALEIGRLYNESWMDHEEFAPLTEEELLELTNDLTLVIDPKLLQVIRKDGDLPVLSLRFRI